MKYFRCFLIVCLCFVCRFAAHEYQKTPGVMFRGFRRAAGAKIFEFWGAPVYYLGPNVVTVYCVGGGGGPWGSPPDRMLLSEIINFSIVSSCRPWSAPLGGPTILYKIDVTFSSFWRKIPLSLISYCLSLCVKLLILKHGRLLGLFLLLYRLLRNNGG